MNEQTSAALAKPTGQRRGRKPRRVVQHTPEGRPIFFSALDIREERCDDVAVLRLMGALDTETLIELRDAAFTLIGARPVELCLDLCGVTLPIERQALESLVTIGRVAKMVKVCFSVIIPPQIGPEWRISGLDRLLPVQTNPRIFFSAMKIEHRAGVSTDGVLK